MRVNCSDGHYRVLITLPTTLHLTEPSLLELRFDKEPSVGYLTTHVTGAALVAAIGGSPTDDNYGIGVMDKVNPLKPPGGEELIEAGKTLVDSFRKAARLAYQLSLANDAVGATGTFTLQGFATEKSTGWTCGT